MKPLSPCRSSILVVLLVAVLVPPVIQGQDIRINELVAANGGTLADEDGDFSDWIELFNAGAVSVDLAGFGLTDDPEDPFKWRMPAVTVAPGAHALIFASDKDRENVAGHWETLIDRGDVWSYRVNTQPPASWKEPGFDASSWSSGASGIGYGDDDDATEVPEGSLVVFARTSFTLEDAVALERAVLHVDYDDGFVAFLNGEEIARANVSGSSPGTGRPADVDREAQHYQGGSLEAYEIANAKAMLQPGENVLAVQTHNVAANSSDLTLIPVLSVGLADRPSNPRGLSDLAASLASEHPHTNFQLSREGETVVLTAPDGTTLDEVAYPSMPHDVAFGRAPDGGDAWAFFDAPTPGSSNASMGFLGHASAPMLVEPPGRYDVPSITVALEAGDASAEIRYTLDGSEPTETSALYALPLTFTATTILRARAFRSGYLPSPIVTGTYLLREATTLPIVALSTDPPNLWDEETGIYVMGPNAQSAPPHFGANFWEDREIPVHLEFIEPGAATPALSLGVGVKIFGGWSRAHAQKSLSVFARSRYGTGVIEYPLLPDKPITEFESFVLRNGGNDWGYTLFRDAMMHYLVKDVGVDMLGYRPVVVFLNGEYWGVHNIREKINEHYVAANHPGVDPNEIDMLEIVRAPAEYGVIHGSDQHFRDLLHYVETHTMANAKDYVVVDSLMDVAEFIDYQIAEIYYVNEDWPGNNLKLWRPRVPGGRWRWILFDTDFGFGLYSGRYSHQTLAFATATNGPPWPNPPHSTLLLRRLLLNPTFRTAFINRFADHLNATFEPARVIALIDEMADEIRAEMPRHNERWDPAMRDFANQVDLMRIFAKRRQAPMWSQLRKFFDLSSEVSLTVEAEPAGAGTVRLNRLDLDVFPWSGSYFPGVPVTVEAVPAPGFRFAGWRGGVKGSDPVASVLPAAGLTLQATFEKGVTATDAVVVSEIQYNAPDDMDTADWIELYNPEDVTIDLGAWTFMDDDSTHTFTVPAATRIAAADYLVLCRDPLAFESVHTGIDCVGPWGDFGLGSGGDMVRVFDAHGALIDSVSFDDEAPWPTEPDGGGATLELRDVGSDNSLADSWMASTVPGGTPGGANSVAVGIEPETPERAHSFVLHPNHPNPFREATTIQYEVTRPGRALVNIFDVLGREVRTLVDADVHAGLHSVHLDASDLASGFYICRLETEEGSLTRTMLLIR